MTDPAAAAAPALSYASPQEVRPKVGLYRVAVFCGMAPLLVGVATLALYALTFRSWLTLVGLATLFFGGVFCVVGLVCVSVFYAGVRRCDAELRRAWTPRAIRTAMLLVANVPVAILCAGVGLYLAHQFPVTLVNETNAVVTDITISSPGESVKIDRLEPGERRRVLLSVNNDGEVTFVASQNGAPVTGVAAGYVSNGPVNSRSEVRFTPGGPVVRER